MMKWLLFRKIEVLSKEAVGQRVVIIHPAAIDVLFDLRGSRMLSPFLTAEHTLSTAAKTLNVAPSTLAHWIAKFLRTRLIREVRVEARNGAPMRWYRAPSSYLFVPMANIPERTRLAFLAAGRQRALDRFSAGMDEEMRRDPATGISFKADGPRSVEVNFEPQSSRRNEPWTEFWGAISLTREQAHTLAEELDALIEHYRSLDGGPVEVVVHAGAVRGATRRRPRRTV